MARSDATRRVFLVSGYVWLQLHYRRTLPYLPDKMAAFESVCNRTIPSLVDDGHDDDNFAIVDPLRRAGGIKSVRGEKMQKLVCRLLFKCRCRLITSSILVLLCSGASTHLHE